MAAEDGNGRGFRIWTDLFLVEVVDPETHAPGRRRGGRRAGGHAAVDQQRHAVIALELRRSRDLALRR